MNFKCCRKDPLDGEYFHTFGILKNKYFYTFWRYHECIIYGFSIAGNQVDPILKIICEKEKIKYHNTGINRDILEKFLK